MVSYQTDVSTSININCVPSGILTSFDTFLGSWLFNVLMYDIYS